MFYHVKDLQFDARVSKPDPAFANANVLIFNINKGQKVRVNEVNFYGNEAISDTKLKKQKLKMAIPVKSKLSPLI